MNKSLLGPGNEQAFTSGESIIAFDELELPEHKYFKPDIDKLRYFADRIRKAQAGTKDGSPGATGKLRGHINRLVTDLPGVKELDPEVLKNYLSFRTEEKKIVPEGVDQAVGEKRAGAVNTAVRTAAILLSPGKYSGDVTRTRGSLHRPVVPQGRTQLPMVPGENRKGPNPAYFDDDLCFVDDTCKEFPHKGVRPGFRLGEANNPHSVLDKTLIQAYDEVKNYFIAQSDGISERCSSVGDESTAHARNGE